MIAIRPAIFAAAVAGVLLLSGCASKEPLDYLPEGTAYVAVNMKEVREDAGTKRLMDVLQKLDQTTMKSDGGAERFYFAFSGVPPQAKIYGVMMGRSGFADQALADLKAAGGSEAKLNGRRAVVGEKFSLSPVNDSAVLFFHSDADLAYMVDTSKRKGPAASQTALFRRTQDLATSHGISLVVDPGPLVAMASPKLTPLSVLSPKGVDALKQSDALLVTMDWNELPSVRATLAGPAEGRQDLASLLNTLLGQVKTMVKSAQAGNPMLPLLESLDVTSGEEGVELALEFPKEKSDAFLTRMETTAANLPKDPRERARALREALSSAGQ